MPLPETLSPAERAAIRAFVTRARSMLGPDLNSARLFGSRARGEGDEQSDLDIAMIVRTGARARRHELYDLAFDIGLEHGVTLAPLVLEAQQLDHLMQRERKLARAIGEEGIPL